MNLKEYNRLLKKKTKAFLLKSRPRASIPLKHLLLGGESGISARQYALLTRDLRRPSTLFINGPHVTFLKQYELIGEKILDKNVFKKTLYYKNARNCMDLTGNYFAARRDDQLINIAKEFIDRFENRVSPVDFSPKTNQSEFGIPVLVQPVSFSNYFTVIDGNHRLAIDYLRGKHTKRMLIIHKADVTPLQQMLRDVLWTRDRFELYQPLDLPECHRWVVVRKCTDRLSMFKELLSSLGFISKGKTYLDIGSYLGWFVAQMSELGFDSYGVEIDPIAAEIGQWVYGIKPDQIIIDNFLRLLENQQCTYDVVSIQSLMHHFVTNKGSVTPEELIHLVDINTRSVLFFEMGQAHESWFKNSLSDWTPSYIETWLKKNTSFSKVVRLGIDEDAVGDYKDNYGRTMFACIR